MTHQAGTGTETHASGPKSDDQLQMLQSTPSPTVPSPATHGTRASKPNRGAKQPAQPRARICRFFGTKNGCRAGDACPYLHAKDASSEQHGPAADTMASEPSSHKDETQTQNKSRQYHAPVVSRSKIVPKPLPDVQVQDPRKYQVEQLKRRFAIQEVDQADETVLVFQLQPSDPDFPFELDGGLRCRLYVPKDFPTVAPYLSVTNKEMGRGFQLNVEKGFSELVRTLPASTLLGLINNLDRRLENLLSGEKADTIKIVRNAAPKTDGVAPELEPPPPSPPLEPLQPIHQAPTHTYQQMADAENKRKVDVRQLEARLGRMPLFEKSANGLTYMVPVEPRRRSDLPVPLQNIKSVELGVPRLYPLEPCQIRIFGVSRVAAEATEKGFVEHVKKMPKGNLLSFLNYLSSSMHILATTPVEHEDLTDVALLKLSDSAESKEHTQNDPPIPDLPRQTPEDADRPHLHFIPRPLEWSMAPDQDDASESDSSFFSEEDSEEEDEGGRQAGSDSNAASQDEGPERGILLSLPELELHGIELLELVSLDLTVRCLRCKDTLDVHRIRHEAPKLDSCKKCAQAFGIGFRRELMHVNSVRAGHLDLDGCTIVDLLPSQFIPTCSSCSNPQPPPRVVSVRGQSSMAICRECHGRMSFKIPEVRFLQVSANAPKARPPPQRKARENLGITAGTELPNRGRCEHYRKSYRWFRFSCCQKVFACDRCHDAATDHPNEHANRMLCGWCSREQLFRPETCAFCRNPVVGRRAGGFWEGGKGTRDKTLMSRKDPRKWKRRATGVPPGQGSIKK